MSITLIADSNSTENCVKLKWLNDSTAPYIYQLYRKNVGDDFGREVLEEFQSVSVCARDETIEVLNIFPPSDEEEIEFTCYRGIKWKINKNAILKKWLEEPAEGYPKGYGRGKINITPISIKDFKKNTDQYLKDGKNRYAYDVIAIGVSNNPQDYSEIDFNDNVIKALKDFLKDGGGILATQNVFSAYNSISKGLNTLTTNFNIGLARYDSDDNDYDVGYNFVYKAAGDNLILNKNDTIIKYPYNLGSYKSKLKLSHITEVNSIVTNGDAWVTVDDTKHYYEGNILKETAEKCMTYLTTYNNTAVIQIGNYNIDEVEKQLLYNALYRMYQLTDTNFYNDYQADHAEPLAPEIASCYTTSNRKAIIEFNTIDAGTMYQYYIRGRNLNTNQYENSNIITSLVTTDIKEYLWCMFPVENDLTTDYTGGEILTYNTTSKTTIITPPLERGYWAFRVIAKDYGGNTSPVTGKTIYIDGDYETPPNKVTDRTPNAVRFNNRYRGPQESKKINAMYCQIKNNINKLNNRYNELEEKVKGIKEKPQPTIASLVDLKDTINNRIDEFYKARGDIVDE